jgi:acetyl-CoA acetyltransferase
MALRTAIVGVGYTPLTANSGTSTLDLALQACRAAIADAGLTPADVDGVATYSMGDSSPAQAVATGLAMQNIEYLLDLSLGGQAPCYLTLLADAAIKTGMADAVVIYRALNGRSGARIGRTDTHGAPAASTAYRQALGFNAYPQYMAMWARRFMIETGATEKDLAAVVMAQRWYSSRNPRAVVKGELTLEQYEQSPMIASPLRAVDCTREVDGACAIVLTSLDRARDMRHKPAILLGGAYASGSRPGLDMGDGTLWADYAQNCQHMLREKLWRNAGVGPADVGAAQIYDCFSSTVLFGLEGLGLVPKGGAGDFIRAGETMINGKLPVNTHGGLLCEGYLHGMNSVAEAVSQLRGDAGERNVADLEAVVVTSGALMDGSAMVLATHA